MKAKPAGAGAVMASKKPRDQDAAPWQRFELFPTPPWATRGFLRQVLTLPEIEPEPLRELTAWEPCAGLGHMAEVLREDFGGVIASDVCDYGFEPGLLLCDFRSIEAAQTRADWIVTNPPFEPAAEFLQLALDRARRGVAFLCRLSWLESAGRYKAIFGTAQRPTLFAPYVERVPMCGGGWDVDGSTATAYAWFVFKKDSLGRVAQLSGVAGGFATLPIAPGCKERFSRESDKKLAARFVENWIPPSTVKKAGKDQLHLLGV